MNKVIHIVMAVLLLISVASAEGWIIQTVDDEGDAGLGTFVWVDSLGIPHIIYERASGYYVGLYHATWTSSGWSIEVIIPQEEGGPFDAVLDSTGRPHIGWVHSSGWKHITYTYRNIGGWHTDTVNVNPNLYLPASSIALDSRGNPHIPYQEYQTWDLRQIYIDSIDGQWKDELVAEGEAGSWFSIGIDQGDHIYVAYNSSAGHLKLAFYDPDSGVWGIQYIDLDDDVGAYCDLILDENGVPHIAYLDATNTRLKYATWSSPPKVRRQSAR